jgi:hypothetical protein
VKKSSRIRVARADSNRIHFINTMEGSKHFISDSIEQSYCYYHTIQLTTVLQIHECKTDTLEQSKSYNTLLYAV